MISNAQIIKISNRLRLSPYQSFMLEKNAHLYNLDGLQKRGDVLMAPYKCDKSCGFWDWLAKQVYGSRVDLIGTDKVLLRAQRGITLFSTGFYSAYDKYGKYFADSNGTRTSKMII